jgi:precorrin-8X/cobalt-precorrin-8 methylmutase
LNERLFDIIVIVDWSAASVPKRGADSIWTCTQEVASGDVDVANHRTRSAARQRLFELLVAAEHRRVLVGFDFSFAYPAGTAAAAGLRGAQPWSAIWDHLAGSVIDGPDNRNNRFVVASALNAAISPGRGPLWGSPPTSCTETLSATKAPGFGHRCGRVAEGLDNGAILAEFRICERRFIDAGMRLSSTWQLLGAGSVGSQTLTGIPVADGLRHEIRLQDRVRIWPFDTGFGIDPTADRDDAVVFAEIWPSALTDDLSLHEIRDARQVLRTCGHLAALDREGALAALFDPPMADDERSIALEEEGWILNAPSG